VHDIMGVSVFLMVFSAIVFFAPELGGYFLEFNNFIPADPLKTPPHIAPVWYFTPFYSMLRATTDEMIYVLVAIVLIGALLAVLKNVVTGMFKGVLLGTAVVACVLLLTFEAKFWGVVVMGASTIILFFLPWLDHSPVKSIRYRPDWHKWVYGIFVFNFFILGYLGIKAPGVWGIVWGQDLAARVSQIGTLLYFGFFLLMPIWSRLGQFKPEPDRVTFEAH
jgi:ubiquinol-cytochrome c reductase cytochrome b subunit